MVPPDGMPSQEAPQSRRSDRPTSTASATLAALHRHLVNALLKPVCPDIQLKAFQRIYSLHRIFLVQSTFFNSLLNGDFKEAKVKMGVWKGHDTGPHDEADDDNAVELYFDDPNITRPAFEYCLATLYGAAPTLVLPSWCCPSPEFPLTAHFQLGHSARSPTFTSTSPIERIEGAQHPATPRFLLSLIATATYLGIPSVASQAVTLILCSITPYTVSQYLRFSLGLGILGAQEAKERHETDHSHWDWELEGPAWSLESLSRECKTTTSSSFSPLVKCTEGMSLHDDEEDDEGKAGSDRSPSSSPSTRRPKEGIAESFLPSLLSEKNNLLSHQGRFYYGAQSDKIGEACSCWLLRWGADVLVAEEQMQFDEDGQEIPSYVDTFTLPRNVLPMSPLLTSQGYYTNVENALAAPHPTVWCHPKVGGIPAVWARTIISSDSFWTRCEWDRYDVARRVVAMRREHLDAFVEADEHDSDGEGVDNEEEVDEEKGLDDQERQDRSGAQTDGVVPFYSRDNGKRSSRATSTAASETGSQCSGEDEDEDEGEYSLLFSQGIYYTHMTFEELQDISNQVCPSTGSTYVPLNVLQSALWAQSELKGMIISQEKNKTDGSKEATSAEEEAEESSASSKRPTGKNVHPDRELGLVSAEADFARACHSLQRKSRGSRASTANSSLGDVGPSGVMVLGGLRPSLLQGAASKTRALQNLLNKRFFAVPFDDTVRIGENLSSLVSVSTGSDATPALRGDQDRDKGGGPTGVAALTDGHTLNIPLDAKRATAGEAFGVQNAVKSGRVLGQEHARRTADEEGQGPEGQRDWTGYEPMRLGVEFFGVDRLKEKERMYSPSFFYAGSIWNLYVQIIKKPKGLQLGIYLHRQNCHDALPAPSVPADMAVDGSSTATDEAAAGGEPLTPRRRDATAGAGLTGSIFYTSSSPMASNTTVSFDGNSTPMQATRPPPPASASHTRSRSTFSSFHNQQNRSMMSTTPAPTSNFIVNNTINQQYRDARKILRAYFSVHCPSPLGTSLTKFSSRPDNFTLSQSWGWKSSSLLGAVYLSDNRIGSAENQVSPTFRCIVTVGVV